MAREALLGALKSSLKVRAENSGLKRGASRRAVGVPEETFGRYW